jgi:hypothetical protein
MKWLCPWISRDGRRLFNPIGFAIDFLITGLVSFLIAWGFDRLMGERAVGHAVSFAIVGSVTSTVVWTLGLRKMPPEKLPRA